MMILNAIIFFIAGIAAVYYITPLFEAVEELREEDQARREKKYLDTLTPKEKFIKK